MDIEFLIGLVILVVVTSITAPIAYRLGKRRADEREKRKNDDNRNR